MSIDPNYKLTDLTSTEYLQRVKQGEFDQEKHTALLFVTGKNASQDARKKMIFLARPPATKEVLAVTDIRPNPKTTNLFVNLVNGVLKLKPNLISKSLTVTPPYGDDKHALKTSNSIVGMNKQIKLGSKEILTVPELGAAYQRIAFIERDQQSQFMMGKAIQYARSLHDAS